MAVMTSDVVIIIADDDPGHTRLVEKNLQRSGLSNTLLKFADGQEVLDFLFRRNNGPQRDDRTGYLLLLDIRMPKVDGVEVLRKIKQDDELKQIPVIILTTTEDPREISRCHQLGCSNYIVKPVDYEKFAKAIQQLGFFISLVQVPTIEKTP